MTFDFTKAAVRVVILLAAAAFFFRAGAFLARAWRWHLWPRLRAWYRERLCRRLGHLECDGWRSCRSENHVMVGKICGRCGAWLKDIRRVSHQKHLNHLYIGANKWN